MEVRVYVFLYRSLNEITFSPRAATSDFDPAKRMGTHLLNVLIKNRPVVYYVGRYT